MNNYRRLHSPELKQIERLFTKKMLSLSSESCSAIEYLLKTNPIAGSLHLGCQGIFHAIINDDCDTLQSAQILLLKEMAELTNQSIQLKVKLSKTQIGNFYGVSSTIEAKIDHWQKARRVDYLDQIKAKKIDYFLCKIINLISVTMAIASNRIIFLNDQFAITYGIYKLESKVLLGELFISVVNSNGIWSFDKDNAIRISIGTLRSALKAVKDWRGANLTGEVTHDNAQRIADFLGLVSVPNSQRNLVMLRKKELAKGFKVLSN